MREIELIIDPSVWPGRPSAGGGLLAGIPAPFELMIKVYIDYVSDLPGGAVARHHDGS
ncbi:MAG TPA: hypothetical protein VLB04_01520 [Methanotrichaceae archaeon]|nr:hypothetical protein [Methanotrichaceae archaeon]